MPPPTTIPSESDREERIRSTALRHAQDIESRKRLQAQIADLIVTAFDLPSSPNANPASPTASDATLFKRCLAVFQPSDLDDLIYERNVDDRCGYALCPRPNEKLVNAGQKVWNRKGGKDFRLLDKADLEKFCSTPCQERTAFVRAQLRSEPAWLRPDVQLGADDLKLLDEMHGSGVNGGHDGLVESLNVSLLSSCFLAYATVWAIQRYNVPINTTVWIYCVGTCWHYHRAIPLLPVPALDWNSH